MRLCVAPTRPVKGDMAANIARHEKLIALARGVDVVFFPELSLTGYEPTLAKDLAIDADDHRLDTFQAISDSCRHSWRRGADEVRVRHTHHHVLVPASQASSRLLETLFAL